MTYAHTDNKYINYAVNSVRSTVPEEFTVDVWGDGTAFAHPRDWEQRIVPAAVEVTVGEYVLMAARVYMPGKEPPFCWLVINVVKAAKIMAQFQRMQEGV